ncbi:hypothetical protein [Bradyrhizobium sp. WSM471]|uniref:hypothetical protein n=1 Tax=Bradyrhizobium sp. WSM471 TaxID=319017 RepID=UPI00024D1E4C|nr:MULTISPECIES: hypothetical protein [Bradyrhizobium]EHR01108.1 hypothetical protein Bra471DRAFT_01793 [Bradyrhizobium sp. WSM471]UFW43169.1 hypothetical protein BcanWSM471_08800 [Bradyrhizobium canariense]
MTNHLYRLRMGTYANALCRRSKREKQQTIWLQYNLMLLGCELGRPEQPSAPASLCQRSSAKK